MYRDAANYKTVEEVIFPGHLSDSQKSEAMKLGGGEGFNINKVKCLPPLGAHNPEDEGYDDELDHPFCELLTINDTNKPTNNDDSVEIFLSQLRSAQG